jgi:16S rRNA G1207 methylase RsmC
LTRQSLLVDYPWHELGKITVVDVGCGAGDSGIDVMKTYPDISWVFQDISKDVLEEVKKVRAIIMPSTDCLQADLETTGCAI